MANSLGVDLGGKVVVMRGDGPEPRRTVRVENHPEAGFGAIPECSGSALLVRRWDGENPVGESFRVNGYEVEKLEGGNP